MYLCLDCNKNLDLEEKQCLVCGCNKRLIKAVFNDTLSIKDTIHLRQKREGFKKFIVELLQGYFPSVNDKLREGVFKRRLIDKQHNKYEELVINNKNGIIIRNVSEPLNEHKYNG